MLSVTSKYLLTSSTLRRRMSTFCWSKRSAALPAVRQAKEFSDDRANALLTSLQDAWVLLENYNPLAPDWSLSDELGELSPDVPPSVAGIMATGFRQAAEDEQGAPAQDESSAQPGNDEQGLVVMDYGDWEDRDVPAKRLWEASPGARKKGRP